MGVLFRFNLMEMAGQAGPVIVFLKEETILQVPDCPLPSSVVTLRLQSGTHFNPLLPHIELPLGRTLKKWGQCGLTIIFLHLKSFPTISIIFPSPHDSSNQEKSAAETQVKITKIS